MHTPTSEEHDNKAYSMEHSAFPGPIRECRYVIGLLQHHLRLCEPEYCSSPAQLTLRIFLFPSIFQCANDDDVANYRQILRKWISHYMTANRPSFVLDRLYQLPHGYRYMTMAQIDQLYGDIDQKPKIMANTLHPASAFDAQETALWVQNLLWRIYDEVRQIDLV